MAALWCSHERSRRKEAWSGPTKDATTDGPNKFDARQRGEKDSRAGIEKNWRQHERDRRPGDTRPERQVDVSNDKIFELTDRLAKTLSGEDSRDVLKALACMIGFVCEETGVDPVGFFEDAREFAVQKQQADRNEAPWMN